MPPKTVRHQPGTLSDMNRNGVWQKSERCTYGRHHPGTHWPWMKQMAHNLKGDGIGLFDGSDVCVARLSRTAKAAWAVHDIRVLAMVCRTAEQDVEQTRRERSRCQSGKSRWRRQCSKRIRPVSCQTVAGDSVGPLRSSEGMRYRLFHVGTM
jgi:hypothetical protein